MAQKTKQIRPICLMGLICPMERGILILKLLDFACCPLRGEKDVSQTLRI